MRQVKDKVGFDTGSIKFFNYFLRRVDATGWLGIMGMSVNNRAALENTNLIPMSFGVN
ncbi:MAG: hypothetical protein HOJ87_16505 [Rhodospirillaceae bacterium]|nr:hypothetical protein [Rhodospirillaceae bacterium]